MGSEKTTIRSIRWLILALLGISAMAVLAEDAVPDLRIFPEKERKDMLKAYWTRMSKEQPIPVAALKEWEARRVLIQKQAMDGFGLDPRPSNVPLELTYGVSLERDDCTISRVYFQTFPGFYATAFLYMPKNTTFPAPSVLHPHGHWANWSADDIVQSRCIGLARRGYVSLVIQYEHFEDLATGLPVRGVFLWNNIRGLDVLESLPQVDKQRIGVTGASGGGMQTLDVAALDPRIQCAAITVWPTYYHRVCYFHVFGCCYYSPLGAMRYMDQPDLIAMIAPRPAAVFTVTGDWTAGFIDHEAKEVAAVYDLFNAEAGPKVDHVEGQQPYRLFSSRNGRYIAERWEGLHDYTQAMRERMYWWMDWWLKGKRDPKPLPEEDLKMEKPITLQALRGDVPKARQWSNPNLASVVRGWRRFQPPALKTKAEVIAYTQKMKAVVMDLLDEKDAAGPKTVESSTLGKETLAGWEVEKLWYVSEPDVRIPALFIKRPGTATPAKKVVIVTSSNGKNDVFVEPLHSMCQAMLKEGRAILAIDQRLRGEWAFTVTPPGQMPTLDWQGNVRVWGRPELGMAAHDIRAAIAWLGTRQDCSTESLRVVGSGHTAGYAALLAAALDARIQECVADLNHSDFSEGFSDYPPSATAPAYAKRAPVLARILRHGNVGEFAALVAPRKLELLNANPRTSFQTAESAYQLLGTGKQLTIQRKEEGADREAAVVNGEFEEGIKGWKCEDGSAPTLSTQRADLGKAALQLDPKQKVTGEPVAIKPLTEYRLFMRVSKPLRSMLNVELLREGQPFKLVSDNTDRMAFEECDYDFLSKPSETSLQIVFSTSDYPPEEGPVLVDTVRLVAGNQMELLKPDGKECLSATGFEKLEVGAAVPMKTAPGFFIPYGPGSENQVVAEGKDGRKALHIKNGPGTYATLASTIQAPLKRGGTYRFEVVARGKGTLGMCFWHIPPHLTSRLDNAELTDAWKTYTLDFFVESQPQLHPLPTVSVTGEMWVDRMSLKLAEAAKP
ncbi:MAG: acetylxylan esterase [Verrucomicrobia bacterium]|nr:acetylxylan esterase [Verrucomicrobiota bacterium]